MKIDLQKYKAVIFDMDGTMVDNTPFHKNAWIEFARRKGLNLTDADYHQNISGKRNDAILPFVLQRNITEEELNFFDEEKESIYREIYAPFLKEISGLTDFLKKLLNRGLRLGVATTSTQKNRKFVLETLGLKDYFQVIIGGEHSRNGKPDPEIYLTTAKELNVNPTDCLAFEDTPLGVQAAKAAGMDAVGVLTAHSKKELKQADYFIKDFTEI